MRELKDSPGPLPIPIAIGMAGGDPNPLSIWFQEIILAERGSCGLCFDRLSNHN
jgi:hypothetical protein